MSLKIKQLVGGIKNFLVRQYFVVFLMAMVTVKLCFFPSFLDLEGRILSFAGGYFFSLLFALIVFLPVLFLKKCKKTVSLLLALFISGVLWVDLVYFRFFQAIPTFGMMETIGQTSDIAPAIQELIGRYDFLLFFDIIAISVFEIFWYFREKNRLKTPKSEQVIGRAEKGLLGGLLVLLCLVFLVFNFVSGPKQTLTDALSWAYETKYNTKYFGIMGSHLIDGYRYLEDKLVKITPAEKAAVTDWVGQNLNKVPPVDDRSGAAAGRRVIIVQVESLGSFVIGQKVAGQEITPNLNRFAAESYYFKNTKPVIGSGHTADADLVANTSIYPLYDSAAFVRYGRDNFASLANQLKKSGYTTTAYHAYNRNFWNRSVAFGSLGYQKFLAAESYPEGNTINMKGLEDREFLALSEKKIKGNPTQSLHYLITLSTHYPFAVTTETNGLRFDVDAYPPFVGGYLKNVNYTDRAIGEFLSQLKKDNLYDDSLIVIYGDHAPVINNFREGELAFDAADEKSKNVPLLIKLPGQTAGVTETRNVTALDIRPSLSDLLGLSTDGPVFGASLFAAPSLYRRCSEGEVIHEGTVSNCEAQIKKEKQLAAKIIRYNLFSDLGR